MGRIIFFRKGSIINPKKASTGLNSSTEIDFMHFQGPGHIILSDKVEEFIKNDF